jgi:hypothetical protein
MPGMISCCKSLWSLPHLLTAQVRELWQQLTDEADQVDFSLEDTKKLFSETTRKQVGGPARLLMAVWRV